VFSRLRIKPPGVHLGLMTLARCARYDGAAALTIPQASEWLGQARRGFHPLLRRAAQHPAAPPTGCHQPRLNELLLMRRCRRAFVNFGKLTDCDKAAASHATDFDIPL
jgi:hypothetical protein